MSGPRVTSGTDSKQDYATPVAFIHAVENMLGEPIAFDLAATAENTKAKRYFNVEQDSLIQSWCQLFDDLRKDKAVNGDLLWLNPPFNDISTWAEKCAAESREGAKIAFLTPASVGANWFRDYVAPFADVYFLNGRISFDGVGLYPKDCMLSVFDDGAPHFMTIWDWRKNKLNGMWRSE